MAKILKIPGSEEDSSAKKAELAEGDIDLPLAIEVQQVVDVARTRAAGEPVPVDIEPVTKDAGQLAG